MARRFQWCLEFYPAFQLPRRGSLNRRRAGIVTGHILAVYLAHVRASVLYSDRLQVLNSQLPIPGLMVLYTVVSSWIVSRPIPE